MKFASVFKIFSHLLFVFEVVTSFNFAVKRA